MIWCGYILHCRYPTLEMALLSFCPRSSPARETEIFTPIGASLRVLAHFSIILMFDCSLAVGIYHDYLHYLQYDLHGETLHLAKEAVQSRINDGKPLKARRLLLLRCFRQHPTPPDATASYQMAHNKRSVRIQSKHNDLNAWVIPL